MSSMLLLSAAERLATERASRSALLVALADFLSLSARAHQTTLLAYRRGVLTAEHSRWCVEQAMRDQPEGRRVIGLAALTHPRMDGLMMAAERAGIWTCPPDLPAPPPEDA